MQISYSRQRKEMEGAVLRLRRRRSGDAGQADAQADAGSGGDDGDGAPQPPTFVDGRLLARGLRRRRGTGCCGGRAGGGRCRRRRGVFCTIAGVCTGAGASFAACSSCSAFSKLASVSSTPSRSENVGRVVQEGAEEADRLLLPVQLAIALRDVEQQRRSSTAKCVALDELVNVTASIRPATAFSSNSGATSGKTFR